VSKNTVSNNAHYGIRINPWSGNNKISENTIRDNMGTGIDVGSENNVFFHNNFMDNVIQVSVASGRSNVWDDGYPSGGNYWSDYTGIDLYHGPYQNIPGSDGIGDTPYLIDTNNQDHYPLMLRHACFVWVEPRATSAIAGQSFNIDIRVSNVSDLYLWVVSISWDPATLEFTSIAEGEFLSRGGSTTGILRKSLNQTGGYLEEAACSLLGHVPGVDGDGILATLTFEAKACGASPVTIYFYDLLNSSGNSIPSDALNGNVNVTAPDLSVLEISLPYPTLPKYANITFPINVTIQNSGTARADAFNVSFTAYWNDEGLLEHIEEQRIASLEINTTILLQFNFTPQQKGSYTLTFRVDCDEEIIESNETNNQYSLPMVVNTQADTNGDGKVDYKDLFILSQAYWSIPGDGNWDARADINYDGKVDYKDLFLLSKDYST
jgi:hypothetical protein